MRHLHDFPELMEMLQIDELRDIIKVAEDGIKMATEHLEVVRTEITNASSIEEYDEMLANVVQLNWHITSCLAAKKFATTELKEIVYHLN